MEITLLVLLFLSIIAIVGSFVGGWFFGNHISKQTRNELKKMIDENRELDIKYTASLEINKKYMKIVNEEAINEQKDKANTMVEIQERAKKKALGEYAELLGKDFEEEENIETKDFKETIK